MDRQPPAAVLTAGILMLICSTAETTGVRLVDGQGRCSGTPQVLYEGEWRRVDSYRFDYRNAMVACRELDCGNTVSIAFKSDLTNWDETETVTWIRCEGNESSVSQCEQHNIPYNIDLATDIFCSDSVRLVDGAGLCSGRVEVKLNQSWTTVCEADFDWQDAEVVCRELGCGTPRILKRSLFGEGSRPFGINEFQCKGTENSLRTCRTLTRDLTSSSAVGLTCSGLADVRLVDGSSRCDGTVEMFHGGLWRRVDEDYWSMSEADVVCRQLDCGSAVAAEKKKSMRKEKTEESVRIDCRGPESALRECSIHNFRSLTYEATVICSDFLEKPTISFSTPIRVSRALKGSQVFRGHSFTITCSTKLQFPGGSFHLRLPWTNRSLSQTAVNYSASFFFPAADDSHHGNYSCVYENQLTFSRKIFKIQLFGAKWSPELFVYRVSSESESLSLTVTDLPLPAVITRMLLVPLLLLISCSVIFLIFKKWGHTLVRNPSGQQGAAAAMAVQYGESIELVSLQQTVKRVWRGGAG